MSKKEEFTVRKVEKGWTEKREYEILRGRKVVLKLGDRDEANKVCKYLNTLPIEAKKKTTKKKTKEPAKQKNLEGENSE